MTVRREADPQRYKMAVKKLLVVSQVIGCPLADLQSRYRNSLEEIVGMDLDTLIFVVRDYIKGSQPLGEALHKLQEGDSLGVSANSSW